MKGIGWYVIHCFNNFWWNIIVSFWFSIFSCLIALSISSLEIFSILMSSVCPSSISGVIMGGGLFRTSWKNKFSWKSKVQLKRLVDKTWPGYDQINQPNHQRTTWFNHTQDSSGQKDQVQKTKNRATSSTELLLRKITEIFMITTEMASPTHSVAAALKERTLDPLTGFITGTCPCRLSTYITIHDRNIRG